MILVNNKIILNMETLCDTKIETDCILILNIDNNNIWIYLLTESIQYFLSNIWPNKFDFL